MDNASRLSKAAKPAKLMRIELSSVCNYRCRFCCWQNNSEQTPQTRLAPEKLAAFCRALVNSGCRQVNITGGEPLLLPLNELCDAIRAIRSVDGIDRLWVTTNGKALCDEHVCKSLNDAGLTEAAVSIAAENDEKYRCYSGTDNTLGQILTGIRNAVQHGISVRVHVPLNPIGVSTFAQLEQLLDKVEKAGADSAYYFRLHNGGDIESRYNELLIDPFMITAGFQKSPRWRYGETESGRPYYTDGHILVNVPRENIRLVTQNCMARNCGTYCQGIYAAYLVPDESGWHLRSCHRVFADRNNETQLEDDWLLPENTNKLLAQLRKMWRYAYDE